MNARYAWPISVLSDSWYSDVILCYAAEKLCKSGEIKREYRAGNHWANNDMQGQGLLCRAGTPTFAERKRPVSSPAQVNRGNRAFALERLLPRRAVPGDGSYSAQLGGHFMHAASNRRV